MQRRDFLLGALTLASATGAVRFVSAAESENMKDLRPFEFLSFTVLASGATWRAWNDAEFREALVADPQIHLPRFWGDRVTGLTFVIHEDSREVKHLILPHRPITTEHYDQEKVREILEYETGGDRSLEHFLPAELIARAFEDAQFRERLIRAPKSALMQAGYDVGARTVIVHANTATTRHLTIPANPVDTAQLISMEDKIKDYIVAVSTSCCASGTCDMCIQCHGRSGELDTNARRSNREGFDGHIDPNVLRDYLESVRSPRKI